MPRPSASPSMESAATAVASRSIRARRVYAIPPMPTTKTRMNPKLTRIRRRMLQSFILLPRYGFDSIRRRCLATSGGVQGELRDAGAQAERDLIQLVDRQIRLAQRFH